VKFSVVLLTFNSPSRFEQRMDELAFWMRGRDAEIVPVLNGPVDRDYSLLLALAISRSAHEPGMPSVRPIALPVNHGFAGGMNVGARSTTGEIVILLSDDVRIAGDFLSPIEAVLSIGTLSVVSKTIIDFPGGWNQFGPVTVPYPDGSLLAMRKSIWQMLGGFDEQFTPAGFEDVDLGYRAAQFGFPLLAIPTLPVDHSAPGQSAPYNRERFDRCVRMKALFAAKHGLENIPVVP
jgi:GT2 family glycosyltransferase